VLNEGSDPTFQTRNAATCIDIMVASPALATLMTDWKVHDEMHMSDHHLISANLKLKPDQMPLRHGRHLRKADWTEFRRVVDNELRGTLDPMLWSAAQIEKTAAALHSAIDKGLDAVAPKKPYKPKKALFSW
jgi:hypothetical protein